MRRHAMHEPERKPTPPPPHHQTIRSRTSNSFGDRPAYRAQKPVAFARSTYTFGCGRAHVTPPKQKNTLNFTWHAFANAHTRKRTQICTHLTLPGCRGGLWVAATPHPLGHAHGSHTNPHTHTHAHNSPHTAMRCNAMLSAPGFIIIFFFAHSWHIALPHKTTRHVRGLLYIHIYMCMCASACPWGRVSWLGVA